MRIALVLFVTAGLLASPLAHAATSTWTGLGSDNKWMTATNWQGNVAPTAGDDLVFPNGAAQTTNVNDFPAATSFNSVTFSDTTGYSITGNSIVLTGGASALSSNNGANSLGLAITFGTAAPTVLCATGTGLTLSGNINNGGLLLTFDCSAPITVSGVISGTGGLDEDSGSSSLLTLSGANNYSGATTIDAGTLSAKNATALGTLGTTVNAGGTLQLDGGITVSQPLTLNGMGSGSGALVSGTGANTWSGNITLASPTFIGGGVGPLTLASPGSFSLGANDLTFVGGGAILVTQVISGSGKVGVAGVGGVAVVLNAANTYTGNTSVSVGTLVAGANVVSGSDSPFGHSTAAVQVGSSFNATLEISGSMFTRPINVVGSGSALIQLDTNADISGAITVSSPLGLGITTNGATASISGTINNGGFPLSFEPLMSQALTVSGAISGSGQVSCDAPGTVVLSGNNAYTGGLAVNLGTIQAGSAGAIPATNDIGVAVGAIFNLNNFNVTVHSIAGAGSITLGTGTLTMASSGPPTVFGGVISGVGGQLKLNSGTLKLTGTNTYTGTTTINGGVLSIDGSQSGSAVAVNAGGVLQGTGTAGAVTVNGGGMAVGDPSTAAAIFNTGAVGLNAASLLKLNLSGYVAGTSMDQLNSSGAFTAAGTLNLDLTGLSAPGTAASIVTYTSSSGAFNSITLSNNPNNYGATLTFTATHLDLLLTAPLPAPTLSPASDSGVSGDKITNVSKPTINGTGANAGATITIFDGATMLGTTTANGSGAWSFTCPSTLSDGSHSLAATQSQVGGLSVPLMLTIDTAAPTLTIAQQTGQVDPTTASPVKFLVTASEPLAAFTSVAVQISGTAGATTASVISQSATQYEVDVSGMTQSGTVIINVSAGAVLDLAGNPSIAATIINNSVTYSVPLGPPPVAAFTQSSDQVASGMSDTFDASASTVSNGSLTYSWDFGDNSAAVTGNPVTHTFNSLFDTSFVTTLTVSDVAGLKSTTSKTIRVVTPVSGGSITGSIFLSMSNPPIVAHSNIFTQINPLYNAGQSAGYCGPGVIDVHVGAQATLEGTVTTTPPSMGFILPPLPNDTVRFCFTEVEYPILGTDRLPRNGFRAALTQGAIVNGFSPTFKFVDAGVAVIRSTLLNANNATLATLRKTLTISETEVGPGTHFAAAAANRSITSIKTSGNFNFNRNTAASTKAKTDKVSFSGTFELPAGMDLSQPQEFQFAIGNVMDAVMISPKGKMKGATQNIQKVQITLPRLPKGQTTTSAGMKAKLTLKLSNTGLSTAGFESDGIANRLASDETGKKSVIRGVQVGMVYAGESYQLVAPVTYKLNSTNTTGVMSGRSGL